FVNHLGLEPFTVCVGYLEPQNVLEIVLDGVPAGRPCRTGNIKARFFDIFYVGSDVKQMAFDAGDRDGVIDTESVAPLRAGSRSDEQDKSNGQRKSEVM